MPVQSRHRRLTCVVYTIPSPPRARVSLTVTRNTARSFVRSWKWAAQDNASLCTQHRKPLINLIYFLLSILLQDPPGKINSFVRGCEEQPILLDEVLDDAVFRTFYRSCTADLCNEGDGTRSALQDSNFSPDSYEGENLILAGMPFDESSETRVEISLIVICWSCLVSILCQ